MATSTTTELRGFDAYPVRLGDELRGERASLGKSLLDVQRELRIKASHIDAIENSDPAGIPHAGYVPGYVRAYARYLGLDEAEVLRRFCEESGFAPTSAAIGPGSGSGPKRTSRARGELDAVLAGSRLAAVSRSESFNGDLGATLRGLGSLAVLVGVLWGLGYGGWALLQNIQRVEFSPLPDAPAALASVPDLAPAPQFGTPVSEPVPVLDARALAAVYAEQEVAPPRIRHRDAPISTIDPQQAGVYGATADMADLFGIERPIRASSPQFAAADAGSTGGQSEARITLDEIIANLQELPTAPPGVVLVFVEEAWVRVRNSGGQTVHEALMRGGQRWALPEDAEGLTLRAGNAGGVFVEIDGERFGPFGRPGAVVSNVPLDADALRGSLARAETAMTTSSLDGGAVRAR